MKHQEVAIWFKLAFVLVAIALAILCVVLYPRRNEAVIASNSPASLKALHRFGVRQYDLEIPPDKAGWFLGVELIVAGKSTYRAGGVPPAVASDACTVSLEQIANGDLKFVWANGSVIFNTPVPVSTDVVVSWKPRDLTSLSIGDWIARGHCGPVSPGSDGECLVKIVAWQDGG